MPPLPRTSLNPPTPQNIVELKHAFYTSGDKPGETYLNVVMEYCSDTVYRVMKHYNKMKQPMPVIFVKL